MSTPTVAAPYELDLAQVDHDIGVVHCDDPRHRF
jgi:hypothetical protein